MPILNYNLYAYIYIQITMYVNGTLRSAVPCLQSSCTKRSPPVSSNHALDLMVSEGCLGH